MLVKAYQEVVSSSVCSFAYMFGFTARRLSAMPMPLAVRTDSLLVQCMIAAGIFFVPQDAAALGLGFLIGRANSRNRNAPGNVQDPKQAIDKFLSSRGLDESKVTVKQGMGTWKVSMNSLFKN